MQNVARFRVANNVYHTRRDELVPRFHSAINLTIAPASQLEITNLAEYKGKPFVICNWNNNGMKFYYDGAEVPFIGLTGPSPIDYRDFGSCQPYGVQCVEKHDCLYLHFPAYGLFKFDGATVYRAGMPLPYFSCTHADPAGAYYVRVIQHHVDYQANVVHSGYVHFRATPVGNTLTFRHDQGATDIVGTSNEYSPTLRQSKLDGTYDEQYFYSSGPGTVDAVNREVDVPSTDNNLTIGTYVLVAYYEATTTETGLSEKAYGVAFKVKAVTGATVTLDLNDVRYLSAGGIWKTANAATTLTMFGATRFGSNIWFSIWTSNTSTGNYVLKIITPIMYQSASSRIQNVTVVDATTPNSSIQNNAFNAALNMGDFYDVTTVKDIFPSTAKSNAIDSEKGLPYSFTTFGDHAVIASGELLYWSDTSKGGSFEMVHGTSNAPIGDGDDGLIQSICGNSEFLIVSKQRNNYHVSGNLHTANYRVQKVTKTQMGSYSNETMLAVEDKVLLLNKQGIWAFYAGGRCEEVSEYIRGLFDDWSLSVALPEQAYWDIDALSDFVNFSTDPIVLGPGGSRWLRIRRDVTRGLIYFLNPNGQALILNMNNGEFTTWSNFPDNLGVTAPWVSDILAINGEYYAAINSSDYTARVFREYKVGADKYGYGSLRLENTWFTAGEPSLEKKLNQVKLFGAINATVSVSHFLDWDGATEIEDGTYSNSDTVKFSHKRRLTPANFQAVSVALECSPGTGTFQVEGMELEFQGLQEGMKR
jgi:hypothetical protein